MKNVIILSTLFALAVGNSACSAIHAAWPDAENLGVAYKGASRESIENEFGSPVNSFEHGKETVYTYEIEIEPKGEPTPGDRIAEYIFWDFFSILLMEPYNWYKEYKWEANYKVDISFDSSGRATYIYKPQCYGDCETRIWKRFGGGHGYTSIDTYYWTP